MAQTARTAVTEALIQFERNRQYSSLALDRVLSAKPWSNADATLISRLFYGTIEHRLTLDYFLAQASSQPLSRLQTAVLQTLRVALYQLLYLDKIPESAAVNEAVNTVRALKQPQAAGFVNGVLRGMLRRRATLWDTLPPGDEGLSIRYSCPTDWIRLWRLAYGNDTALRLLEAANEVPAEYLRINTLRAEDGAFSDLLHEKGINHQICEDLPHCFRLECASLLNQLETEKKNWYYYQDKASQWACAALEARPGETVADVCAAPGGKSFTVAQAMHNRGRLLSCDIYPNKCETMERRAKALGITVLQTAARDAAAPCAEPLRGQFDRVMCDVPCSGLGVIRRKPEIRYKSPAELAELPALQYRILESSAAMVRSGGVLHYSTCTLNPAENEQVAERFLREHTEFEPRILPLSSCFEAAGETPSYRLTLLPFIHGTDGFFIAGFQKK